jgi:hypothetical protein
VRYCKGQMQKFKGVWGKRGRGESGKETFVRSRPRGLSRGLTGWDTSREGVSLAAVGNRLQGGGWPLGLVRSI